MGVGMSFYGEDRGAIQTADRLSDSVGGIADQLDALGQQSVESRRLTNDFMDDFDDGVDRASGGLSGLRQKLREVDFGGYARSIRDALDPGRLTSAINSVTSLGDGVGRSSYGFQELAYAFDNARFSMKGGMGIKYGEFLNLRDAIETTSIHTGTAAEQTLDLSRGLISAGISAEDLGKDGTKSILSFGSTVADLFQLSNEEVAGFLATSTQIPRGVRGLEGLLDAGVRLQREFKVEGLLKRIPSMTAQLRTGAMQMGRGFAGTAVSMVKSSMQIGLAIKKNLGGSLEEAMSATAGYSSSLMNMAGEARAAFGGLGDFSAFRDQYEVLQAGGFRGNVAELLRDGPKRQAEIAGYLANALSSVRGNRAMEDRMFTLVSRNFGGAEFAAGIDTNPQAVIAGLSKTADVMDKGAGSFEDLANTAYKSVTELRGVLDTLKTVTGASVVFDRVLGIQRAGMEKMVTGFTKLNGGLSKFNRLLGGEETSSLAELFGGKGGKGGIGGLGGLAGKIDSEGFIPFLVKNLTNLGKELREIHPALVFIVPVLAALYGAWTLLTMALSSGVGAGAFSALIGLLAVSVTAFSAVTAAALGFATAIISIYMRAKFLNRVASGMNKGSKAALFSMKGLAKGIGKYILLPLNLMIAVGAGAAKAIEEMFKIFLNKDLKGAKKSQAITKAIVAGLYAGFNNFFFGLPEYLRRAFTGDIIKDRMKGIGITWVKTLGKGIGTGFVLFILPMLAAQQAAIFAYWATAGTAGLAPVLAAFVLVGYLMSSHGEEVRNLVITIAEDMKKLGKGMIEGALRTALAIREAYTGEDVDEESWVDSLNVGLANAQSNFYAVGVAISNFFSYIGLGMSKFGLLMSTSSLEMGLMWDNLVDGLTQGWNDGVDGFKLGLVAMNYGITAFGIGVDLVWADIKSGFQVAGAAIQWGWNAVMQAMVKGIAKVIKFLDPFLLKVQMLAAAFGYNGLAGSISKVRAGMGDFLVKASIAGTIDYKKVAQQKTSKILGDRKKTIAKAGRDTAKAKRTRDSVRDSIYADSSGRGSFAERKAQRSATMVAIETENAAKSAALGRAYDDMKKGQALTKSQQEVRVSELGDATRLRRLREAAKAASGPSNVTGSTTTTTTSGKPSASGQTPMTTLANDAMAQVEGLISKNSGRAEELAAAVSKGMQQANETAKNMKLMVDMKAKLDVNIGKLRGAFKLMEQQADARMGRGQ